MATDDVQRLVTGTAPAPATFTVPGNGQIRPKAIFASYNGTSAAVPYQPALKVTSDAGKLVGIYPTGTSVAAGASADVSWFPEVASGGTSGGGLPILTFVAFTPAGNKLAITSTNPAVPTTVATTAPVIFSGTETVEVQFYASAIDLDQRTFTGLGSVLLELYIDNTALGVIADYNANPNEYTSTSCYTAAFDVPAAGSHAYSIRGYKQVSGGTGPGDSFVYGTGVTTPHATRPGFLVMLLAST